MVDYKLTFGLENGLVPNTEGDKSSSKPIETNQ